MRTIIKISILLIALISFSCSKSDNDSSTSTIKTSTAISTFTISTILTNLKENTNPLTVTYEFYIDGKKTASKSLFYEPNDYAAKSLILDVSNPTQIIAN